MPPKKKTVTEDNESVKTSKPKTKSTSKPKTKSTSKPKTKSTSKPKTKSPSKPKTKNVKKNKLKDNNNEDVKILDENDLIEIDNSEYLSDYREIINTYNPSNNKTSSILTIYEAALIVGKRATQITLGADPVIEYNDTDTPETIAVRELLTKNIPYIIKRQINNVIEYWKIGDMVLNEEDITIYY
jgi:DNA-directed RNA polymerase subunit K/omega